MFQFGVSFEVQLGGGIGNFMVGWGLGTFANRPWHQNLFGVVRQGAPGVRRYGVIVLGLFVTMQFVDIATTRAALQGQQSSVHGKNPSRPRSR